MKRKSARYITEGAIIAALYTVLTLISSLMGLSSGVIQCRLSEAMCILPLFTPAAIPGLFIGCVISNLISGGIVIDVIAGSLATLIAAVTVSGMKRVPYLAALPNIILNTAVVPFILKFAYGADELIYYLFLTVGIGELISSGIFGTILYFFLKKHERTLRFFRR